MLLEKEKPSGLPFATLALFLMLMFQVDVAAQYFDRYSIEDGMRTNQVHDIEMDSIGRVWISTPEGISCFNGETFEHFIVRPEGDNSLSHSISSALVITEDHKVFAASHYLINEIDIKTGEVCNPFSEEDLKEISLVPYIRTIACFQKDSIWFGTTNGLGLFVRSTEELRKYDIFDIEEYQYGHVRTIAESRDKKHVWLGEGSALVRVDKKSGEFIKFRSNETSINVRNRCSVQHIEVTENEVWAGTWSAGLIKLSLESGILEGYQFRDPGWGTNIFRGIKKINGRMLIAAENGLLWFDPQTEKFTHVKHDPEYEHSIPAGGMLAIAQSDEGVIWIGGESGLIKLDPFMNKFQSIILDERYKDSQPNSISAYWMAPDGKTVYISEANGFGLTEYKLDTDERIKHCCPEAAKRHPYPCIDIADIIPLSDEELLLVDSKGFYIFNVISKEFEKVHEDLSNEIYFGFFLDTFLDSKGRVWTSGINKGLACYDFREGTVKAHKEEKEGIYKFVDDRYCRNIDEDSEGNIWTNTRTGIARWNEKTGWQAYTVEEYPWLRTEEIISLCVDPQDRLWIASNGQGLIRTNALSPGSEIKVFTEDDGLPGNFIGKLGEDSEGNIFGGSQRGFFWIDKEGNLRDRFLASDGLPQWWDKHPHFLPGRDGTVMVGISTTELIIFSTDDLSNYSAPPIPWITEFQSGDFDFGYQGEIGWKKKIKLPNGIDAFSCTIQGITSSQPGKLLYRYRLMGLASEWSKPSSKNHIAYTNISEGTFNLEIQSSRDGKIWSDSRNLEIDIVPILIKRKGFQILLLLLFAGLVAFLIWYRVKRNQERRELQSQFDLRIAEVEMTALRAQMNPHFLFNSLNSINKYIVHNQPEKASDYLTTFSRLMRLILQNSKSPLVSLSQEMESLNLYIEMEQLRFNNKFEYQIDIADDVEQEFIEIPPLILQPFVENAIWHGLMNLKDRTGKLLIRVSKKGKTLQFLIEDNGVGREASENLKNSTSRHKKSLGLEITKDRLALSDKMNDLITAVEVEDLHNEQGMATGTRVIIKMTSKN